MQKAALVTGGAKRIGKCIIESLVNKNYDIALHYNTSFQEAIGLKKKLEEKGVKCELFKCNLSNESEVSELINNAIDKFPHLSLLINNASVFKRATLFETELELYNETINVNIKAPFILIRDFARKVKKGQIINIIDAKISGNDSNYFAYLLSKKALKNMTLLSAKELGPHIRVNGICPGIILEPQGKNEEYLMKLSSKIPLKKKGNVEDIIEAIIFLENNEYITGQILYIDGGQHL